MGYRLAMQSVSLPHAVMAGATLRFELSIRNEGWARLFNPRPLQLILRARGNGRITRIEVGGIDPRSWLPGKMTQATGNAALPADLPVGEYDVLVSLPDGDASLRADPRYAIQFANADVLAKRQRWNAALGAFEFGTVMSVTPHTRA